jgi:uncharacterized protein (DUF2126 family)
MSVARIHEDPRASRPYTDSDWRAIGALGHAIDAELEAGDVRLTQGGEPTFVAIDHREAAEWSTAALGAHKWKLAEQLAWRLRERFAPGGMMLYGQGKWYPGEPLPRWAIGVYWRVDGTAMWRRPELIAAESAVAAATLEDARRVAIGIAQALGLPANALMDAYEEPVPSQRSDLREIPDKVAGLVLPLRAHHDAVEPLSPARWETSLWPLQRDRLYLLSGDSPLGYRLPIAALPEFLSGPGDLHEAHTAAERMRHAHGHGAHPMRR